MIQLIPNIPKVCLLTLTNCSAVTDSVIIQLVEYCPYLSGLDIGGCKNITDKSLDALAQLQNLLWLTISKTYVCLYQRCNFKT